MGIETRMAAPGFWDNQEKAQEAICQLKSLKTVLKPLEETLQSSEELAGLLQSAKPGRGLVFMRDLARANGAELEIDTAPGQGLTARIVFPAARCLNPA